MLFEDEKVNGVIINETIDTIPLYDEKSFENVSFKEDVNELFERKNIPSRKPFINENIIKELNKNKNITNNNNNIKKNNKKKNIDTNINKVIKPLSKLIPNLSLTPNKNKDFHEDIQENNYNYTDRIYNGNKYNIGINPEIKENSNEINNNIRVKQINKSLKTQNIYNSNDNKKTNKANTINNDLNNKDIIIINKKEESNESKNSNKNKQNYPPKIILFSNSIKDINNNDIMLVIIYKNKY